MQKLDYKLDHIQTLLSSIDARMRCTIVTQIGCDIASPCQCNDDKVAIQRNLEQCERRHQSSSDDRLGRASERGKGEGRDRLMEVQRKTSLQGDMISRSRSQEGLEFGVEPRMAADHQGGQLLRAQRALPECQIQPGLLMAKS